MLKFVVTSCPRSGTGYFAKLFNELNLKTGHEAIFHPNTREPDYSDYVGESSWMSLWYLEQLPQETVCIHLHRNPRLVVKSNLELGFFDDNPPRFNLPYIPFAKRLVMNWDKHSPQERAERFWVRQNEMIEDLLPHFNIAISLSINELNCLAINKICSLIGVKRSTKDIKLAMERTAMDVNNKKGAKVRTLAPATFVYRPMTHKALSYGYYK